MEPLWRPSSPRSQAPLGPARDGYGFSLLGEQLKQASQAYEACLARHAVERRQCEAQVCSLMMELQVMSTGMAASAGVVEDFSEDSSSLVQPPPAARVRSFLMTDAEEQPRPPTLRLHLSLPKAELPKEHAQALALARAEQADQPQSRAQSETSAKMAQSLDVVCEQTTECGSDSHIAVPTGVVRQRLLARLGHMHAGSLISGQDLYQAVSALGLERYSLREMNCLVHKLALAVKLQFRPAEPPMASPRIVRQISGLASDFAALAMTRRTASDLSKLAEQAEWSWPEVPEQAEWTWPEVLGNEGSSWTRSASRAGSTRTLEDHNDKVIPLKVLIKAMTVDDTVLKKLLGGALCEQLFAIKEVLVTGDANRLVSELTCVRIDDLATRKPEEEWFIFEPLVGLLVLANGIAVGFQTDPAFSNWDGWLGVEIAFTVIFSLEMIVRLLCYGLRQFWCGPDNVWNLFDVFLLGVGIAECCMTAMEGSRNGPSPSLVRVIRLLKLVRLVRIFRLRVMRELQLMIKGLLGGLRTLCWAFVLLLFILYALGVATYSVFGDDSEPLIQELYANVPSAMFTTFRCVVGDCFTRQGTSITSILVMQYGLAFSCCYFITYVAISLGVFNVILAIYVEATMTAAKQTEGRHDRESIRVAHITKRLLKLFCAAAETFNRQMGDGMRPSLDMRKLIIAADLNNTDINESTSISKEVFLIVVQEPEVQRLMDQLDIPPDRASLFDSIDADASGSLHASELVMGLLKVRGDVKKSDQVACLLALRAVQSTLREMDSAVKTNQRMLENLSTCACRSPSKDRLPGSGAGMRI